MSEDDDLDEYEFSEDDGKFKNQKGSVKVPNKPHDEEYELSADLSIAESFDAREKVSISCIHYLVLNLMQ